MKMIRLATTAGLVLALSACSVSSMLGGGGKAPATLLVLTPDVPPPGEIARTAAAGQAITVEVPVVAKSLRTTRVPAQVGGSAIAYIKDLKLADTPNRLFKELLAETILRTTNRVVLDSQQTALDPGTVVSGRLESFSYEAGQGTVLVRYDAAMSTAGGAEVVTRRFEARAPADGTAMTVGPALNEAANDVARNVAAWVDGR